MAKPVLISFIVPCYNVERYVEACFDSICRSGAPMGECEVIFINDGSTDNTDGIINRLRHEELRIKRLNQRNCGLGAARNAGIQCATGRYLCFVDSDDQLLSGGVNDRLIEALRTESAAIIAINVVRQDENGRRYAYKRYDYEYDRVYSPARNFMQGRNLMPMAQAYLWSREHLTTHRLTFPTALFHEDEQFTTLAFLDAESFMAVNSDAYLYVSRHGSITNNTDMAVRERKIGDVVTILSNLRQVAMARPDVADDMAAKMAYLTVDTLRLIMAGSFSFEFKHRTFTALRRLGLFPLPWRWNIKYILFNLYTRLRFAIY